MSHILPCLILLIVTILIFMKFRSIKVRKNSLNLRNSSKRDNDQASNALIAILILFLICELPKAIIDIFYVTNRRKHYIMSTGFLTFSFVTRLLNASLNLIICCAMSHKFRRTFRVLFSSRISIFRNRLDRQNCQTKETGMSIEMT